LLVHFSVRANQYVKAFYQTPQGRRRLPRGLYVRICCWRLKFP
jgi:hypothetical protein